MSSKDFIRPIEYVSIWKNNHGKARDRGIRLYCSASPETHGADNARYTLQIFAPLQRHDGSEGKGYMIASASLSGLDLVALGTEVDAAIAEVTTLNKKPRKTMPTASKTTSRPVDPNTAAMPGTRKKVRR